MIKILIKNSYNTSSRILVSESESEIYKQNKNLD